MTNLAGHDIDSVLEAFGEAAQDERPACLIAYTIKGFGLPLAGHKDNHSGMMSPEQITDLRDAMGIATGDEWEPSAKRQSTPEGFGRLLADIPRRHQELADRIVTTSPDVTVSTNLGGWVNRRGVFPQSRQPDAFRQERALAARDWTMGPRGQHLELGIAENNLFNLLAALGLTGPLFGQRLLPVGTLYDPFIRRGLDALNYACYQNARFPLVATPSGLSLAPEGGAHQSVLTPLIGMGQPGLTMFEPAHVDELAEILRWSFDHMQADDGGAVYLRLSTRPIDQPERMLTPQLRAEIIAGGYWLITSADGAELAVVAAGAVVPKAIEAHRQIVEDIPGAGLLVVTSASRLHHAWMHRLRADAGGGQPHIAQLLQPLAPDAGLVTVLDGHPATLSWMGSVGRHRVLPLGVDRFGQSGDIPDLYRAYSLDVDAILNAAARISVRRLAARGQIADPDRVRGPVGEPLSSRDFRQRPNVAGSSPTMEAAVYSCMPASTVSVIQTSSARHITAPASILSPSCVIDRSFGYDRGHP